MKPEPDTTALAQRIDCPVCAGQEFNDLFEKGGESFCRCNNCGLTLINPRPDFSTIRAGYDAAYSAGYTRKADKKHRRAARRVRRVQREYGLSGRWLDVGCSAGFVVAAAAAAGYDAYGVDIEEHGVRYGRETLGLNQLALGLLEEQSYPQHHFQVISAYDVIEHVPDLNGFVAELSRILAPEGVIDLGTPDIGHWRVPKPLETWPEFKPSEHLYYFNRATLDQLVKKHGLYIHRKRLALKPGLKVTLRHQ